VHRLNAVASRWEDVVAPDWARHKLGPTQAILAHLERAESWQGKRHGDGRPPAPPPGTGAATPPGTGALAPPGTGAAVQPGGPAGGAWPWA
jgi:hypothetical protein